MQKPYLAERVHVNGYQFPFFVIAIDEANQVVDLVSVATPLKCLQSVPFRALLRGPGGKD